jgi:V/A-type H+-transporting ATPase subunit E
MSLDAILEQIINEANSQKEKVIEAAEQQAGSIIQATKAEAGALYQELISKAKFDYENQKQRLMVNARLEYKKKLLQTKQELIDSVFKKLKSTLKSERFKKQQVLVDKVKEIPEDIDFYLSKFRQDYETEIARILF